VRLAKLSFSEARRVLIAENYLQSQSYLKCQDDFRSAFPKSPVPDRSGFRLVANFRETGLRKSSGHPTVLNGMSVENMRHSLVQV
jgi:hypothetical protein